MLIACRPSSVNIREMLGCKSYDGMSYFNPAKNSCSRKSVNIPRAPAW